MYHSQSSSLAFFTPFLTACFTFVAVSFTAVTALATPTPAFTAVCLAASLAFTASCPAFAATCWAADLALQIVDFAQVFPAPFSHGHVACLAAAATVSLTLPTAALPAALTLQDSGLTSKTEVLGLSVIPNLPVVDFTCLNLLDTACYLASI